VLRNKKNRILRSLNKERRRQRQKDQNQKASDETMTLAFPGNEEPLCQQGRWVLSQERNGKKRGGTKKKNRGQNATSLRAEPGKRVRPERRQEKGQVFRPPTDECGPPELAETGRRPGTSPIIERQNRPKLHIRWKEARTPHDTKREEDFQKGYNGEPLATS